MREGKTTQGEKKRILAQAEMAGTSTGYATALSPPGCMSTCDVKEGDPPALPELQYGLMPDELIEYLEDS